MTFDEFIKKYDGKPIDFDSKFGSQCVDLIRYYLKEVLNKVGFLPVTGAKDIWDCYFTDDFIEFHNTPKGIPQNGDIVIWGKTIGQYGHIAIFVSGDANNFTSFDQNWPAGSPCHLQGHDYKGVIGWLRPKEGNKIDEFREKIIDYIRKA